MRWRDKIKACPLWIGVILHFFTPTIYCLGVGQLGSGVGQGKESGELAFLLIAMCKG